MPRIVDGDDPVQIKVVRLPNFPEMGFRYQNLSFYAEFFDQKSLKVCYEVSLSKNFQWQSCSAINYLSNSINVLRGDDPVPVINL